LVVDVNVWISTLLSPKFLDRVGIVFDSPYHLLVSEQLSRELGRTIHKPHLKKRIDLEDYDALVTLLRTDAELVDVHSTVEICRDPKDNFLPALAKGGNADYLITGDNDLLVMKQFEQTKIVMLSEFELL
jgi:putative PIN family toxin of toxin-antitoxin system